MRKFFIVTLAIVLAVAATLAYVFSGPANIAIRPGPIAGVSFVKDNARGAVWCEIGPVVWHWTDIKVHVYTSTSVDDCTEERAAKLDMTKLAADLKVPKVVLNPGRYWVMDRATAYQAGEVLDFHGVKAQWAAFLSPIAVAKILGSKPYSPAQITRDTEWFYMKGKPVYLLRTPEGKVWVLQVFTKDKDPTLSLDTLDQLGTKLQLPPGWKFEVKVLDKDLSLQPRMAAGVANIMRDNLGNTYHGCGFDTGCNYLP
jgi:hypothetical protein